MLKTDLDLDFIDDIQDAANRVDGATEAGLDAAADVLFDAKVDNVERTYQRPIPRGQNGRPRWKRTGKWKAGQRIRKVSRFKRAITTIGAAAKAITNHAGGYEERVGKLSSERRNEAAEDARNQAGSEAEKAFVEAFNKKLNL